MMDSNLTDNLSMINKLILESNALPSGRLLESLLGRDDKMLTYCASGPNLN